MSCDCSHAQTCSKVRSLVAHASYGQVGQVLVQPEAAAVAGWPGARPTGEVETALLQFLVCLPKDSWGPSNLFQNGRGPGDMPSVFDSWWWRSRTAKKTLPRSVMATIDRAQWSWSDEWLRVSWFINMIDVHFYLFHEWCHFKPLNQWNLASPWWNKPSGTASRVASCSRGLAAICITKIGRWMICWVNWPNRLLMHMRLVYWSLGLNLQKKFRNPNNG